MAHHAWRNAASFSCYATPHFRAHTPPLVHHTLHNYCKFVQGGCALIDLKTLYRDTRPISGSTRPFGPPKAAETWVSKKVDSEDSIDGSSLKTQFTSLVRAPAGVNAASIPSYAEELSCSLVGARNAFIPLFPPWVCQSMSHTNYQ
ncbi:hypothetical protein CRV24_003606 [Beauveria bassiana]|nr:hypothetical protein CRV24_003606 [Beauveria bassiana]